MLVSVAVTPAPSLSLRIPSYDLILKNPSPAALDLLKCFSTTIILSVLAIVLDVLGANFKYERPYFPSFWPLSNTKSDLTSAP